ncbi:hypothetical protein [Wolbachia endosymbiont (group B) of Cyclophora punctaria]
MVTVCLYARVSSGKQVEGNTIETQPLSAESRKVGYSAGSAVRS